MAAAAPTFFFSIELHKHVNALLVDRISVLFRDSKVSVGAVLSIYADKRSAHYGSSTSF